jgi:hypothetical protein
MRNPGFAVAPYKVAFDPAKWRVSSGTLQVAVWASVLFVATDWQRGQVECLVTEFVGRRQLLSAKSCCFDETDPSNLN